MFLCGEIGKISSVVREAEVAALDPSYVFAFSGSEHEGTREVLNERSEFIVLKKRGV